MPIYSYVALKQGKEVVQGEVTASNLKDARDVIRKMGLVPTKINEFNDAKQKRGGSISPLSLTEKIDFISTLQILLQSGIPAVESLMFMEQEAAKKKIRETSKVLKTQIMAGSTFADTMARYPQVFGYIFIGLINFLMTFVAVVFVDKVGRKPLLYFGLFGMTTSLLTLSLVYGIDFDFEKTFEEQVLKETDVVTKFYLYKFKDALKDIIELNKENLKDSLLTKQKNEQENFL